MQLAPAAQAWPQSPQARGSLFRSRQASSQQAPTASPGRGQATVALAPSAQLGLGLQRRPRQNAPEPQLLPQAPQWAELKARSTQAPEQQTPIWPEPSAQERFSVAVVQVAERQIPLSQKVPSAQPPSGLQVA
jgi:hypothetical protein